MKSPKHSTVLDGLLASPGKCLTPESARRLQTLKADADLQAQVNALATRHREGRLTPEEQAEYGSYVSYSTSVALLKSKARQLLAASPGE
jgi:hypothetical protein